MVTIFPALRDWIGAFLDENTYMIASKIEHNMLIEQVLRLLNFLVKFGYYGDVDDVRNLLDKLIGLIDGSRDLPFPPERQGKGNSLSCIEGVRIIWESYDFISPYSVKLLILCIEYLRYI